MERMFGFLNIKKPRGLSSREVVNHVQRIIRPTKVGHSGTLDPMATGVLVLCVGAATRLTDLVHRHPKSYRATFRFGARSDTDDATGNVEKSAVTEPVSRQRLQAALNPFVGDIEQRPPVFSAVHIGGKRAYRLARKGHDLEIPPRRVVVHSIEVVEYSFPELVLNIECGSGTYIRSIGRDLGEVLSCGAIMTALTRTWVGPFDLADSVDLESLVDESSMRQAIQPPTRVVSGFPSITCSQVERDHLRHGRRIPVNDAWDIPHDGQTATNAIPVVTADDKLVCLARFIDGDVLAPTHVFDVD